MISQLRRRTIDVKSRETLGLADRYGYFGRLMATSVEKRQHELGVIRETIESVWVAIILAFVLRAFMIEAFVIPTRSMAPRRMGPHYAQVCPAGGVEYSYGWQSDGSVPRRERTSPSGARCPSCTYRFTTTAGKYLNGGDRVLVMKYLYKFAEPKPFDVVVFRNPQSNANNYIKRLIGLPGETLEIVHGDVFVTPQGAESPEIRRKPDRAQNVMWQTISDNDYQPDMAKLKSDGMYVQTPRRWDPLDEAHGKLWERTNKGRSFVFQGSKAGGTLEFRGVREINEDIDPGRPEHFMREAFVPRYGYNPEQFELRCIDPQVDVCSDLKLSLVARPLSGAASVECMLDGLWFSVKAIIDTDGTVTVLARPREAEAQGADDPARLKIDPWVELARAKTSAIGEGSGRKIELAHVDHSVKVWVGGKKVIDKNYSIGLDKLKKRLERAHAEPLPIPGARIAVSGGRLELTHLKLMRDVYYTDFKLSQSGRESLDFLTDYARKGGNVRSGDPGWGVIGNPITLKKADAANGENPDLDEFFVLGDNSPQSLDSRGWIEAAPSLRLYDDDKKPQYKLGTVPRYNMIGKAMFVYWPSGFRLSLLPGLPIIPDVGRMRLIR